MAKVGYVGNTPNQTSVIVARQFVNVETDGVGVVTFNSGYTPGYLDVYLNGVKLQDATDFSAADGNTVNLTTTATTGDVLELVAFKALTLGASNVGINSGGTIIASDGIQTLNFVGAGNTFLLRGNTVDISIEGGGAIGVSSNTFDSLAGAGFTHFNFIGAAVTAVGTGDVGGAKTAVVTINKTFTIGTRTGVANLNVTSGIATIALRTGVGTIRF
mgnify:CR=1 FL=1|tara:strand:+ start:645 stop:1292 length:648 start_codon:yes stop_codon:yes gene_type:complete